MEAIRSGSGQAGNGSRGEAVPQVDPRGAAERDRRRGAWNVVTMPRRDEAGLAGRAPSGEAEDGGVRYALVERLRATIAAGRYGVSTADVAEKLMGQMLRRGRRQA